MNDHGAGRRVPVARLQPGDHSCLIPTQVEARWEVLTAYTRDGLACGEKVLLVLDPNDVTDDDAVARLDGATGHAEAARQSGQLALIRSPSLYLDDGPFSAERQIRANAAVIDGIRREGWSGFRAACDMSWAAWSGTADEELVNYESMMEPVFTDYRFTAICWYDQRRFTDHLVAVMRTIHPLQVMERLDTLEVTAAPDGARFAGCAGLDCAESFDLALHAALERQPALGPYRLELDLTDLLYMESQCAWQLVDFAAGLPDDSAVTVRCGPVLGLVLRGLGADAVPQLTLHIEE